MTVQTVRINLTALDGSRPELYLPKKESVKVKAMLRALLQSRKTGLNDRAAEAWLGGLAGGMVLRYAEKLGLVKRVVKHTITELYASFVAANPGVQPNTQSNYKSMFNNMIDFIGDVDITTITTEKAAGYREWCTTIKRYKLPTINRRIKTIRQFFRHAIKIGWLKDNPFAFVMGGSDVNKARWDYISVADVNAVIAEIPSRRWRLIVALMRFCGARGASEMYSLTRDDITLTAGKKTGSITLHAKKTKRFDNREIRVIPLRPEIDVIIREYLAELPPDVAKIFPCMTDKSNPGVYLKRLLSDRGVDIIPYNLRRSYCCDIMEAIGGADPRAYEYYCGHSWADGMKAYQHLYPSRQQRAADAIIASWARNL